MNVNEKEKKRFVTHLCVGCGTEEAKNKNPFRCYFSLFSSSSSSSNNRSGSECLVYFFLFRDLFLCD